MIVTIISGLLISMFTFFISMNEIRKKSVLSFIQYVPKEYVDLIVTVNDQLIVGEIKSTGKKENGYMVLEKAYIKHSDQRDGEWKKVGNVQIPTSNVLYIRKGKQ